MVEENKDTEKTDDLNQHLEKSDDTKTNDTSQDDNSDVIKNDDQDGFFKSTMKYIRGALSSKDESSEDDSGAKDDTLSETAIPDGFSNAVEALGWSGDDIIEFASKGNNGKPYTDEQLKAMIPELLSQSEEDSDKTTKAGEQDTKQVTKPDTKSEVSDDNKENQELREQIKKEVIEELGLGDVQELRDSIQQTKENQVAQIETARINRANELFDNASKEFDIFGLTKDLPKYPAGKNKGSYILSSPAMKARAEVFGDALAFMSHYESPIDEAMGKALDAYKGKHLKDDVKRGVIKDLKKHERNLSGSRTSKEVKKSYDSKRDEEIDYIRNLQQAAGAET